MDRDEVMYLYKIEYERCDQTRAQALLITNYKSSSLFADGLVCCHRSFIIIKGITRLFHKHLKVPRSHF